MAGVDVPELGITIAVADAEEEVEPSKASPTWVTEPESARQM